jgi:hypothetical protein
MRIPLLRGVLGCALVAASVAAHAQSAIVIFPERQKERKASRWTLADWLSQKREIDLQNAWLARHSNKVPVDLTLSAEASPTQAAGDLDLYVAWLGLKLRYEDNVDLFKESDSAAHPRNSSGQLGLQLRLVGGNPQNTGLVFRGFYEYDHVHALTGALQGPYTGWGFGPEIQLYLAPWLGVRADIQWRLKKSAVNRASDARLGGKSWSTAAFVEYYAFRLEGGWSSRTWSFTSAANAALDGDFPVEGLVGRVRLFF